jgi:hypothetical protein
VAVFPPVLETSPQLLPLQPVPAIDQFTAGFVLAQTVAVKDCCCPSATVAAEGEIEMAGEQSEAIVIEAEPDSVGSATLVAISETGFAGGSDAGAV